MKYMLLLYSNEANIPKTPEEEAAMSPETWFAYLKELKTAGVLLDNNGFLSVNDATTVRVRGGKTLVADGPFAETHEQLGGYFLLECKDLDEAIGWAAKIPSAAVGSIEIRPLYSGA